mgnify:CR=1 FL=1
MSPPASPLLVPGVEATFVAGPTVRAGRLAVWDRRSTALPDTPVDHLAPDGELAVVAPVGARLSRRVVPCRLLEPAEAVDALVALAADAPATPSVRAWSAAARATLHLIARGRLLPTADADGCDLWRAGPLDAADLDRWQQLADALPAPAHAAELAGSAPRRVSSPGWLLARFRDALVDAYVRTAAAPTAAGHDAFASTERQAVAGSASWLVATGTPADATVSVALRVEADDRPPADLGPGTAAAGEGAAADEGRDPTGSHEVGAGEGAVGDDRGHDDDRDPEPGPPSAAPGRSIGRATTPGPDGDAGFEAVLVVQSRRDPSLVLDAAEVWQARRAVAARFGDDVEEQVLLALRRGARVWAPLDRLLRAERPDRLALDPGEVDDLLGPLAADLAGSGIDVLWPAEVFAPVRVRPTVEAAAVPTDRAGGLGFDGLCELRWTVSVDGEPLTDDEVAELAAAKRSVVRLRGRWVRADPERLGRVRSRTSVSAGAALAAALGGDLQVDGETVDAEVVGPIADLADRLRRAEEREDVEPPADLRAELRPYQRRGLSWLASMAELGLGGVLADDMGLGKTVQFIALHLLRREAGGPTLVVCPVSVIANWQREVERFAPGTDVRRVHGSSRDLSGLGPGSVVLTTYGVVRRSGDALAALDWGLVAADEAQNVKNPLSRTARAMRRLRAEARFALTGTPVENRLLDLWALLDWTTPGLLGSQERFRHELAIPVERDRDPHATDVLARLVRPFVLRRRKVDPGIAPELPPKTETDEVVGLTTEQATLYRAMVDEVLEQVEQAEPFERRGLVLKLLSGLKQICNHPAQFLRQTGPLPGRSGKLDALGELIDTITDEGESVLVFTQFVTMGRLLVAHLGQAGRPVDFLHGSVPQQARQAMVDRFQAGETPVFVISLKAGGTGLNLTRATHVVHFDRWWNPAVEDQASDRAWRIGQDRPVQVHRLICEGTVEDRVAQLLEDKRRLADAVVGSGEAWIGELSDADLRALVSLGGDG